MQASLIESNRISPITTSAIDIDKEAEIRPDNSGLGCCGYCLIALALLMVALTFPFSMLFVITTVKTYERAVIFRLGRIKSGTHGPGLILLIPCVDQIHVIDLRTIMFDVEPQAILTRDSVTVAVDAVVYYKVLNPVLSVTAVTNVNLSTKYLAQTTLRNVLGSRTLTEILSERDAMSQSISAILDQVTHPWGVKVERVEIKDVRLPQQLQRSMAAEAEANREANAKVIAADGEMKASRALKEAAEIMSESPAALQLRYLQTLTTISAEKNSTVIFPLPIEIMNYFNSRRAGN